MGFYSFLLKWIYLGLNSNCFWFSNLRQGPLILDSHFKNQCVSYQTFSEILRISEKDWQLNPRFFNKFYLYCKLLRETLMLLRTFSEILRIFESDYTLCSVSRATANPEK
jgi:hypothetical protein